MLKVVMMTKMENKNVQIGSKKAHSGLKYITKEATKTPRLWKKSPKTWTKAALTLMFLPPWSWPWWWLMSGDFSGSVTGPCEWLWEMPPAQSKTPILLVERIHVRRLHSLVGAIIAITKINTMAVAADKVGSKQRWANFSPHETCPKAAKTINRLLAGRLSNEWSSLVSSEASANQTTTIESSTRNQLTLYSQLIRRYW